MDYKSAGVDIEAGYKSVELMKKFVKSTMRPEVLGGLGGFSGAFSLEKIKEIFEAFTLRVPFSKSYKIHDLESVAILEDRDYQDDGEVITGYISEKNKWRLEEFYD